MPIHYCRLENIVGERSFVINGWFLHKLDYIMLAYTQE